MAVICGVEGNVVENINSHVVILRAVSEGFEEDFLVIDFLSDEFFSRDEVPWFRGVLFFSEEGIAFGAVIDGGIEVEVGIEEEDGEGELSGFSEDDIGDGDITDDEECKHAVA